MLEQSKLKELKAIRIRKYFIEATEQIIREEGVSGVTIRKVSKLAGYNSATTYNYFDSLEHLITFASLKFMKPYTNALALNVNNEMNSLERYIRVFNIFAHYTFSSPEIFYNLFYGKYGYDLADIIKEYYEIYPEELSGNSGDVLDMLFSGNIFERERHITQRIYLDGFIGKEDADRLVDISICCHEFLLHQMCQEKGKYTIERQCQKYETCLCYLLKKMKRPDSPYVESLGM
jgi:AcrR family transcriptional regulator